MGKGGLSRYMLKYFEINQSFTWSNLFRYYIKQVDSMLPCVCSVIDHRRRHNVVRTSVTHSAIASCATFLFLPHFDVICDRLFCSYHMLTSSVIYYWTDARHWIYLLNIIYYCMASSESAQDEPNRALWLATREGKMEPSCRLGNIHCIPQAKFESQLNVINPFAI